MADPTKILIIAANPWDKKRLGVDEEYREIKNVWQQSKLREQFILEYAPATRDVELRQVLLDFEPNIVHFSGHGTLNGLFFQDNNGQAQEVGTKALTNLFALFSGQMRCVVLNSCYSEEQAGSIVEHIDHVIGMNAEIGDQAAIKFSTGFYQALFNGKDIAFSHQLACNAIELFGINEQDIPVLLNKGQVEPLALKNYLDEYQYDVAVHAVEGQKEWAEVFVQHLRKLLLQRFPQGLKFCLHTEGDAAFDQAATNLLLLSQNYLADNKKSLESLPTLLHQQRVFLADYHPAERPQVLTGLLSYCFWQVDPTQGLRSLAPADHKYNLQIENLAEDVEKRLNVLFQQQQLKAVQTSNATQIDAAVHDAVVFVNAAAEDRFLAQQIQQSLGKNGVASTLPIDHSLNPPPADIRRDFEINLLNCDATLVIYDISSPLWAKEQLLMCHRWQRKREEPLKIIALHNGNGELPDVHLPNLQVFYCPPETIEEYLTKFIGALQ